MFLTRCGLGGGGATLFRSAAASVQDACNKRNFANGTEMVLRPPLPRQPKPQSHTKRNKRKWGMGGMHQQKKRCPMSNKKKKKKGQADRYVAEEKNQLQIQDLTKSLICLKYWHLKQHILYVFVMRVHMCHVQVNKDRPSAAGQHDCASGTSCSLSTVTLEDVLASDVYSCATWDYIQSDLLEYLK